jgi:hypothetical protein
MLRQIALAYPALSSTIWSMLGDEVRNKAQETGRVRSRA